MHLLKYIIVGAAVGFGINYITKKGANGRSIIEEISDDVPHWFEQVKEIAEDAINSIKTQTSL